MRPTILGLWYVHCRYYYYLFLLTTLMLKDAPFADGVVVFRKVNNCQGDAELLQVVFKLFLE